MNTPGLSVYKNPLCSFHFAGLQAGSANIHLLCAFSNLDPDGLDVGFPNVIGTSMRMADIVAKVNAFSADSAFRHNRTSFVFTLRLSRNRETIAKSFRKSKPFLRFFSIKIPVFRVLIPKVTPTVGFTINNLSGSTVSIFLKEDSIQSLPFYPSVAIDSNKQNRCFSLICS